MVRDNASDGPSSWTPPRSRSEKNKKLENPDKFSEPCASRRRSSKSARRLSSHDRGEGGKIHKSEKEDLSSRNSTGAHESKNKTPTQSHDKSSASHRRKSAKRTSSPKPSPSAASSFVYRTTQAQPPIQYAENPNSRIVASKTLQQIPSSPEPIKTPPLRCTTPLRIQTPPLPAPTEPIEQPASPEARTPPLPATPIARPELIQTPPLPTTPKHLSTEKSPPRQSADTFDMFAEPVSPPQLPKSPKPRERPIVEQLYSEYEDFLMSCDEYPKSDTVPNDSEPQSKDEIEKDTTTEEQPDKLDSSVNTTSSSSSSSESSASSSSSSSSSASSSPLNDSSKMHNAAATAAAMLSGTWDENSDLLASDDELLSKAAALRQHIVAKKLQQQQHVIKQEKTAFAVVDWDVNDYAKTEDVHIKEEIKDEVITALPEPEDMLLLLQSQQPQQTRPAISMKLNVAPSTKPRKIVSSKDEEDFTVALAEKESAKTEARPEKKRSTERPGRQKESRTSTPSKRSSSSSRSSRHRRTTRSPKAKRRRSRSPIRRRSRSPLIRSKRSSRPRTAPFSSKRRSRSPIRRKSLSPRRRSPQPSSKSSGRPYTPPHPAPPSPSPSPPGAQTWREQYPNAHAYGSYDEHLSDSAYSYRRGDSRSLSPKRMDLDHRIASALSDSSPSMSYGKYHGGQCGPPLVMGHPGYNILLDDSTFYYDDPPQDPSHTFSNYSNLIEIVQSGPTAEPFAMQKGNVLEIVPKGDAVAPALASQAELDARKEHRMRRKQERAKKRMEKFMRKEKLKLEIKSMLDFQNSYAALADESGVAGSDEAPQDDEEATVNDVDSVFVKAVYNPKAPLGKSCLRNGDVGEETPKTVLFSDGVRPGDGTSASDSDDTTPLPLRDRNKRAIKKRLDNRQRKKMNKAAKKGIKGDETNSYGHDQVSSKMFIDPELENMAPPSPPPGDPPAHLPQPTIRITKEEEDMPEMVYFHYYPKTNYMNVSLELRPDPKFQPIQIRKEPQQEPLLTPPSSSSSPSSEVASPLLHKRSIAPPLPAPMPTQPHWSDTMPPPLLATPAWEPIAAPPPSPLFQLRTPPLPSPTQPGTPPPLLRMSTPFYAPPPSAMQHGAPLLPHPPTHQALHHHRHPSVTFNRTASPLIPRHMPLAVANKPPLLGDHHLHHLVAIHPHHQRPLLASPPTHALTTPLLSTPPPSVLQMHHMMHAHQRDPNMQ